MDASLAKGYSSKVEIQLIVAGQKLNVARIGGNQLELRDRIDLPPCDAEVVISIDGQTSRTPIVLTAGLDRSRELVEFTESAQRSTEHATLS